MKDSKIEEAMKSYWGERCPDHEPECVVCKAWDEYDIMRGYALGVLWTKEDLSKLELAHVNMIKNCAVPYGDGGWVVPHKR